MTADQIRNRLIEKYTDAIVDVVDLTGTQDHYQVVITSSVFEGLSRLAQQRVVMDVFQSELQTGEIHAFTIQAKVK